MKDNPTPQEYQNKNTYFKDKAGVELHEGDTVKVLQSIAGAPDFGDFKNPQELIHRGVIRYDPEIAKYQVLMSHCSRDLCDWELLKVFDKETESYGLQS